MLCATVNDVTVFTRVQRSANDQQQAEHEQKMVDAEPDVLDAIEDVVARQRERALALRHHQGGGARLQHVDGDGAVEELDAREHVGDGRLQPADAQRLPAQGRGPQRPGLDRCRLRAPRRGSRRDRRGGGRIAGKFRLQGEPHVADHRGLPQHVELAGPHLAQLEIGRPDLVRRRGRRDRGHQGAGAGANADQPERGAPQGAQAVGAARLIVVPRPLAGGAIRPGLLFGDERGDQRLDALVGHHLVLLQQARRRRAPRSRAGFARATARPTPP